MDDADAYQRRQLFNFKFMKNENELLDLFQVEELEKRYEMGWISSGEVSGSVDSNGTVEVKGTIKF